jgi:hypothetical protein
MTAPALATTVSGSGGASWAALPMGGSAAQHDNFWELFVRPPGAAGWRLATPPGVASNGGLVAAIAATGSLVTAFRPSQDLTFSPLAATSDAGRSWAQGNVLDGSLARLPDALAAGPAGRLLALTQRGVVDEGTDLGARWEPLVSLRSLARATGAGTACPLTSLTATAWTGAGDPLIGGSCGAPVATARASGPGQAPIFTVTAGSWHEDGPALPAGTLPDGPVSVLGLGTDGTRVTALLAAGTGTSTVVMAAWSGNDGASWSLSPAFRTGPGAPSVSVWADGATGVVLTGQALTIGWQAARWRVLPSPPPGTAALAQTPAGQTEALAPDGGTLTVWQLGSGATWTRLQSVHVTIPYGSSS